MGNGAPSTSIIVGTHVCSVGTSCLTLCDPMYCSPPSSSVHGILFFAEPHGTLLHNCEKLLKVGSADKWSPLKITNGYRIPLEYAF